MTLHTDRDYENELNEVRRDLRVMGERVLAMLDDTLQALLERNAPELRRIDAMDDEIDQTEVHIDELCIRILARRQPVATDLRFITMTLKAVTDLERMADHCASICRRGCELLAEPPLPGGPDLAAMAATARSMVRDAVNALLGGSEEAARAVIARDRGVDDEYARVFGELMAAMRRDPSYITRAFKLQSIAKHLERLADHATNLAELAVFLAKATDIRHRHPTSGSGDPLHS
ncbi:MAG: phosphate signaling complex protein PhoU [Myxococcota bacterium]